MTYYLNASMTGDIIGRVVKTIGGDMNPMVLEYMDIRGETLGDGLPTDVPCCIRGHLYANGVTSVDVDELKG